MVTHKSQVLASPSPNSNPRKLELISTQNSSSPSGIPSTTIAMSIHTTVSPALSMTVCEVASKSVLAVIIKIIV